MSIETLIAKRSELEAKFETAPWDEQPAIEIEIEDVNNEIIAEGGFGN